MNSKLPKDFYLTTDVVALSQQLLGKVLVVQKTATQKAAGIITETEAYKAPEDKASHAYQNKRTKRTEIMFAAGGVTYVYLCYGIHSLLNIVSGPKELPHAILIRGLKPINGLNTNKPLDGPGKLTKAMAITTKDNGLDLTGNKIWLEDRGIKIKPSKIIKSPRIGIAYAEEYVKLPWRFRLKNLS